MKLYPGFEELKDKRNFRMFFREDVGTLKNGEFLYELSICNSAEDSMIITSKQTGRKFTMSWSDICKIAVEKGIDSKDEIPGEGVDFGETVRSSEG